MNGKSSFDFRSLLKQAPSGYVAQNVCKCVVGVAWTGDAVGLVALAPEAAMGTRLKAYNNITYGPIESDWEKIAHLIEAVLPTVFLDKGPRVFLGGAIDKRGLEHPVEVVFQKAFPDRVVSIQRAEIEVWAGDNSLQIAQPRVPENAKWVLKPLYAAAETALFAGRVDGLLWNGECHTGEQT